MPTFTDSAVRQLSDGNVNGTVLGGVLNSQGTGDMIAFYGATPVVQPTDAAQAALSTALGASELVSYELVLSPSAVAANTTAEQTFTCTGLTAGSAVVVNKPTAQAGLGIAGVRVSATDTLAINFSNDTASPITPTTSQTYQVIEIKAASGLTFTQSLSPAAVAAEATVEQLFTMPSGDVPAGTALIVNKPTSQAGLGVVNARVVSSNQVAITFINNTASPITPTAAESYLFMATSGLGAINNMLVYGVNVGTLSATATITVAEQAVAVSGILATDVLLGVSKPTAQAGLGIAGQRATTGNVNISFVNPTVAGITPTASEIYEVGVFRQSPVAPLKVYTSALVPVAVAANTTAEQTFTVTGLVASSSVMVNKPSATAGLAVVGARVSGANTLALTFQNNTASAITPPAETYTVGNFQQIVGGTSAASHTGYVAQSVRQSQSSLVNAIRSALVSLGLIAGA